MEIIVHHDKNNPDCNIVSDNNKVICGISGTIKMGTSDFDKQLNIAYCYNKNVYVGMFWNVTKIEDAPVESVEAKE
jgi:hypothetical protein